MSRVYLHGFAGQPTEWDQMQEALPGEALDLNSYLGNSWETCLRLVSDELRALATVIGYSLGARIALGLAMDYPSRIQALVMVSGSPGIREADRKDRRTLDAIRADQLVRTGLKPFFQSWYNLSIFKSLADKPELKERLINARLDLDPRKLASFFRVLGVAEQPDYFPKLSKLRIPALFIAGADDPKYVSIVKKMADACPRGEYAIIKNAGHMVHLEQPEACRDVVKEFCDRVEKQDWSEEI
jgi:2-succinyl-6-hydroxy-2,4-cyclohexadiene-1-carboxylate synthase